MTKATKYRDKPHARVYQEWFRLDAWRQISPQARCILVEMLAEYRPGYNNGALEWPQSRVVTALRCGNAKADEAMVELEKAGWITVTRLGGFSGARLPTTYRLTMHPCDMTGDPPTDAFKYVCLPQRRARKPNQTGSRKHLPKCQLSARQVPDGIRSAQRDEAAPIGEVLRNMLNLQGNTPVA